MLSKSNPWDCIAFSFLLCSFPSVSRVPRAHFGISSCLGSLTIGSYLVWHPHSWILAPSPPENLEGWVLCPVHHYAARECAQRYQRKARLSGIGPHRTAWGEAGVRGRQITKQPSRQLNIASDKHHQCEMALWTTPELQTSGKGLCVQHLSMPS